MKFNLFSIVFLIMLLSITLVACSNDDLDYDDFPHIDDFSELDEYDETGDIYLVYIYVPSCPACQDIFDDIVRFNIDHSEEYPMVFSHGTSGTPPAAVRYVPTILVMQDGDVLEDPIVGPGPVLELLDDMAEGNYTP